MKKSRLLIIFLIVIFAKSQAQDKHYSQFYADPLGINPGNAGAFNGDLRAYTVYRMQWFTVTNPYKTFTIAVDGSIFKKKMKRDDFFAAGVLISNDNVGTPHLNTTSYNAIVSYTKYIGGKQKHDITLGYKIGFNIKSISTGAATWDSQWDGTNYNPAYGVSESGGGGIGYVDMSTGLIWNFRTTHLFRSALGFSFDHFTAPNVSIHGGNDKLIPKLGVQWNIGYKLSETSNTTLLPSLMVAQQGSSLLINGGVNVKYVLQEHSLYTKNQTDKAFYIGIFYRFRDAAFVTFRYDYADFSFSAAYDANISGLLPATKSVGGFEIAIRYRGVFGKNTNTKRTSVRFF